MDIKCWGVRGSIPVSGSEYLKYGGDTTCLEIRTKSGEIIIVDAGTGIRRLGNALLKEKKFEYHFFMTHAHWDHLMGFPFFKPLYLEKTRIRMHQRPFPNGYMKAMITKVMTPPNFPVRYADLTATITYEEADRQSLFIGDTMEVQFIKLSHPNTGRGYKFIEDGKTFVFLPDNELSFLHADGSKFEEFVEFAREADLLIHDAEYTPDEYENKIEWGHSRYTDAVKLAMIAQVKKLGLFHHNQERSDEQVDSIVEKAKAMLSEAGSDTECFATAWNMEFQV